MTDEPAPRQSSMPARTPRTGRRQAPDHSAGGRQEALRQDQPCAPSPPLLSPQWPGPCRAARARHGLGGDGAEARFRASDTRRRRGPWARRHHRPAAVDLRPLLVGRLDDLLDQVRRARQADVEVVGARLTVVHRIDRLRLVGIDRGDPEALRQVGREGDIALRHVEDAEAGDAETGKAGESCACSFGVRMKKLFSPLAAAMRSTARENIQPGT